MASRKQATGSFGRVLLMAGVPFALIMGTWNAADAGELNLQVFVSALIAGLIFGVGMAMFYRWWGRRNPA